jgi:hypothetical protein
MGRTLDLVRQGRLHVDRARRLLGLPDRSSRKPDRP